MEPLLPDDWVKGAFCFFQAVTVSQVKFRYGNLTLKEERMSAGTKNSVLEWSTKNIVNNNDQFPFWADTICEKFFQLKVNRRGRGGFLGTIETHPIKSLIFSRVRSEEHIAELAFDGISRLKNHYFKLHIQNSAMAIVHQHGIETVLNPGDAILIDSLYPFRIDFPGSFECSSVKIPRQMLRPMLKNPKEAAGTLISSRSPINLAIRHYIHFLIKTLRDEVSEDLQELYLINLLGLIAAGASDKKGQTSRNRIEDRISNIKRYMLANLEDPDLTPSKVAAFFSISISYLHKLFAKEKQSFGNFLREQRLISAAKALQNQSNSHRTVSELAFHYGFNDLSHFWRLFRKKYGMTPNKFRKLYSTP